MCFVQTDLSHVQCLADCGAVCVNFNRFPINTRTFMSYNVNSELCKAVRSNVNDFILSAGVNCAGQM